MWLRNNVCLMLQIFLKNYLCVFNFLATPYGMWDLSSPTRDRTCMPCTGNRILTTGLPGKSPLFLKKLIFKFLLKKNMAHVMSFHVILAWGPGSWSLYCSNLGVWSQHCVSVYSLGVLCGMGGICRKHFKKITNYILWSLFLFYFYFIFYLKYNAYR